VLFGEGFTQAAEEEEEEDGRGLEEDDGRGPSPVTPHLGSPPGASH
jgi:hypothetical protein